MGASPPITHPPTVRSDPKGRRKSLSGLVIQYTHTYTENTKEREEEKGMGSPIHLNRQLLAQEEEEGGEITFRSQGESDTLR